MEIFIDKNDVYNYTNSSYEDKIIYGSLNGKFEVGDKVKIIKTGQFYSSYNFMAKAMNIPSKEWNVGSSNKGDIGIIINRKVHEDKSDILYGVKIKGVHIYGEEGLELVSKYMAIKELNDEDFEI